MDWKAYGQITAAANSLRKYYGLPLYHTSDTDTDAWLSSKRPRCIIAILVDAMGISVMEKHLSKNGFFYAHLLKEMTTVFPPTTSAATTSFRTGRSPSENGWLGWDQYFQELDDNIILFRSQSQYTHHVYPGFIPQTMPYKDLVQELHENGIASEGVWPDWSETNPSCNYADLLKNAASFAEKDQMRFVYAYWDALDTCMHLKGPSSSATGEMIREIESETASFVQSLPEDCAVMVIADHSQIDIHQKDLQKEKELCACFRHEPALEPRAIAFYIQPSKKDVFAERFQKAYDRDYHLYTQAEVLRGNFFGEGTPHPRTKEFVGDYLAVSETDLQLYYKKVAGEKGDHAGGTKEEAMIPLILCTKK